MADELPVPEPDPPREGTVTFLFTDIAGSTRMLRQDQQAYGVALADHRCILRAAFAAHRGREVDTQGDSFFVAFPTAGQAVAAAADAQRALAAHSWPEGMPVLVRMGVHTGEATPAGDGYLGLAVHRAARIAAAAAGGQVLVSNATAALIGENLPAGTALHLLGTHRLKDFAQPAELYQLDIAGLPTTFAPVSTLPRRTALPVPAGELLGREADVSALATLLGDGRTRLVTVVGPGGMGKTRLAVETARTLSDVFPGGVVFVPLSAISDERLLLGTVADAVGAHREPGADPLDALRAAVGEERTLLVLDNFEQVVAAGTDVAALLDAVPAAVVLVTSRQALRLRSERQYPLAPLAGTPAQQLFAERAATVSPGFVLDAGSTSVVAEICRLLDGLPLAIELAAARVRLLPPAALLARLGERLDLLGGGPVDLPERQRTLRATMDWSFGLLGAHERAVFTRLAVFSGGWTVEAAEVVCGRPGEPSVLDTLSALLDASLLLQSDPSAPEPRLQMLETVRTYAAEKLAASPDRADAERRHGEWMLAITRSFWHAHERGFREALERFDDERANLRAALQRAIDDRDVETAAQLLRNTFPYLLRRDAEREAVGWLAEVGPRAADAPAAVRGRLLVLRALFAGMAGDLTVVRPLLTDGRRLLPDDGEDEDRALVAAAGTFAAMAEGSIEGLAYAAILRADLALVVGDLEGAERHLRATLGLGGRPGDESLDGPLLSLAGLVLLARGDAAGGHRAVLDGAAINRRSGQPSGIAYSLEGLASVALADGRPAVAARALAAAATARQDVAPPLWPVLTPLVGDLTARSRQQLGDRAAEAADAEGRRWQLPQALNRTLEELAHPDRTPDTVA